MDDFQVKFDKAIKEYATKNQYGISLIPNHIHNGTDTNRINQKDIIANVGYGTFLVIDASETFVIKNIPNLRRLTFKGFAANNAIAAATKRVTSNGEANFGKFFSFAGTGSPIVVTIANVVPLPFIQHCCSMYVDSTDLTKNRVNASGLNFMNSLDDTGAVVCSLTLDSYINDTLTITSVVGANWKINGVLTLT